MAQVLLPIAQTSSSIAMPYSSDAYRNPSAQPQQRGLQMQRNYNTSPGSVGYKGTSAPIAPYAFSATPMLHSSNSTPNATQQSQARLGHPSHASSSSDSTVSTSGSSNRSLVATSFASKDDSDVAPSLPMPAIIPELSLGDAPAKPSPGRYRRAAGRTDSSSNVSAGASTPIQASALALGIPSSSVQRPQRPQSAILSGSDISALITSTHNRASSADDSHIFRAGSTDAAKRYRRRSFNGLEEQHLSLNMASLQMENVFTQNPNLHSAPNHARPASSAGRPGSQPASSHSHERQGSVGSSSSKTSAISQARAEPAAPRSYASVAAAAVSKPPELVRRHAPSPLSKPISASDSSSLAKNSNVPSPAVRQLNAVNNKDNGMKSRLRRAFSFGSAAELRRASAENNISAERAKLRKDKHQQNEDAEQAAIIAKQEAAGIGAGIYSGQGGMGSTDNLSIQSAASSASIMLRKMGHGVKRGTKSIKGLFRPKSVIGVPAADGPVTQPSVGQVSLVNVEAERQRVNVDLKSHDQVGGGNGYPCPDRNPIDAGRTTEDIAPSGSMSESRKSILGGDHERAEILSSIKRGILKRAGTSSNANSPVLKPIDTPRSSSPVTRKAEHGRVRHDYFDKPPRILTGSTVSLPTTPHGSLRNISFSPRIQFHDAWSSQDYDRRGEVATCNRLTPMLAQQIKEELNSFKMEMEVHEQSKPHTHFF